MTAMGGRALGLAVAVGVTAALVALSRAPYDTARGTEALLRLSWSGRPERIERCRALTDAELAERPAHMRRRLECTGHPARYQVRVRIDGAAASLDTVTGGGLRGDRAIHMLREYRLPAGVRAVGVELTRLGSVVPDATGRLDELEPAADRLPRTAPLDRGAREREERMRQLKEALPPHLALDTTIALAPGAVVLVTYDPTERRLLALTGPR